jgi:streptomycin 6-kinase
VRRLGGGNVAVVCAADQPVVLKLNPRIEGLATEAAALRFWRDTGAAVELLDARDDDYTMLLERLEPGTPTLADLGGLVARLHTAGPPPPHFPHLTAWFPEVPPADTDVLLHLDLHAGNAMRSPDGWKAIDPKGFRGDPHADIWALIDPLAPTEPDVETYARAADLDPRRAAIWTRRRALSTATEADVDDAWRRRLRLIAQRVRADQ